MDIGIDFDGVIGNFPYLKSYIAKKLYGISIPAERFKKEFVVGGNILNLDEYKEIQKRAYRTREFGSLIKPMAGAIQYLLKIIENGHNVTVITARDGIGLEIAKEWTLKEGILLDFIGVGYGGSKATAASGLDIYMDDDLDKLEQLIGIVPRLFLFSWEYNKHIIDMGSITRVETWKEFFDKI